jgi:hypothetical protein
MALSALKTDFPSQLFMFFGACGGVPWGPKTDISGHPRSHAKVLPRGRSSPQSAAMVVLRMWTTSRSCARRGSCARRASRRCTRGRFHGRKRGEVGAAERGVPGAGARCPPVRDHIGPPGRCTASFRILPSARLEKSIQNFCDAPSVRG